MGFYLLIWTYLNTVTFQFNSAFQMDNKFDLWNRKLRHIWKTSFGPCWQYSQEMQSIYDFKAIRGMALNYLTSLFNISKDTNYNLPSSDKKLSLPKPWTSFLKNSFSYRGSTSWNLLPLAVMDEINDNTSLIRLKPFKKTIIKHCKYCI